MRSSESCCVKVIPCFRHPVISCRIGFAIFSLSLGALFASYTTILVRRQKANAKGSGGTGVAPSTPPPVPATASPLPEPSGTQEEPPPSEETPRLRAVADKLVEATSEDVLMTKGTPQNLALIWITNEDARQVHPSHPNLVQRYALATLYFATGGSSWSTVRAQSQNNASDTAALEFNTTVVASPRTVETTNWLTPLHECEWMFVSCKNELATSEVHERHLLRHSVNLGGTRSNKDRRLNEQHAEDADRPGHNLGFLEEGTVVGLNLAHKNLIGQLPPEIGALESIETLDLASNSLNGEIPVTIGSMEELQILRLNNNYFSSSIPGALGSLTKLEELRLEKNNELTGEVPLEVCNLVDFPSSSTVQKHKFTFPKHLVCSCCDESVSIWSNNTSVIVRKSNETDIQQIVENLEEEVEELQQEVEGLQQEVENQPLVTTKTPSQSSTPAQVTTKTPTQSSTIAQVTTTTPTESSTPVKVTTTTPTELSTVKPNDTDKTHPAVALEAKENDGERRN